MTKMPPNTLPNSIIPMPNGIEMTPLPSGMTDSALNRIAKMKNPSWKPAM